MGVLYSVTDLAKLDWMGDKHIYEFLMTWRLMLDQMQTTLPADELTEILMQKMEKSAVLKETSRTSTGWMRATRKRTVIS